MAFVPDSQPKNKNRFVPDREPESVPEVSASEAINALKTGTLGEKRVQELGGPLKAAYKTASIPSRELTRGLKRIVSKIPDPQTQSVATNVALGIPEMIGDIGAETIGGSISPEALLLLALPEGAIAGPLERGAGALKKTVEKKFPAISQAMTGVNKRYFSNIKGIKDILPSFLGGPKSISVAGEAVEAAEKKAFGKATERTIEEINDTVLSTARKNSIEGAKELASIREIAKSDPEMAAQLLRDPEIGVKILKAKRGSARQLEAPGLGGTARRDLQEQKHKLSEAIGEAYPEVAASLKDYSRSITRDEVTKLLPVLKNGDPSVMRMFLALMGRDSGVFPGFSVPAAHAVATALAKTSLSALEGLAGSPVLRKFVQAEIARRKGEQNAK